ncbi:conserved Plasmodium protein, unknown function [Plasmodium relictum]|uniref:Uncharacterized protein n=1 Tax=Plasmodium relictum TaxID=85471 RepID=A0A1J1H3R5_PLARL|nr:conserved Plasmodium protein, unknown function [Plasmodium relictum]CRG99384.1 conserved Plasmodium protein, unknown function [Plasmodium relictum]
MDNRKSKKPGRIAKMINEFYINWNYRRHSWRASFYYNCLTIIAAFNIIFTLIFQQFIKSFNFFINYSCEYANINFMLTDLLIFLVLTSFISILAFFLSRICSIFSNFTINDFMSLGECIKRIGCTAKWFPWGLAILFVFWFVINIFNLITLYVTPNLWCKRRLNITGTLVVNNCRIFEGRRTSCTNTMMEHGGNTNISYIRKCNDLSYLKNHNYFIFIPDFRKESYKQCNFNNLRVCIAYRELRNDQHASEKAKGMKMEGCLENTPTKVEEFYDKDIQTSDLYKYAQIFTIGSNVTFFLLMFFFYFIKYTTQFDGLFYQSTDNSEIFILQILRPLTPWS